MFIGNLGGKDTQLFRSSKEMFHFFLLFKLFCCFVELICIRLLGWFISIFLNLTRWLFCKIHASL